MSTIRYSITKIADDNGVGTYRLTYSVDAENQILLQKDEAVLTKEDADGTKNEERVSLPIASIASYSNPNTTGASLARYNGFAVNVSDSNLAVGGTYYSVESTVGTYVNPNSQQSGNSEPYYVEPEW